MATTAAGQPQTQQPPSGPSLPPVPPVPALGVPGAAKAAAKAGALGTAGAVGVTAATLHALSGVLAKQRMINRRWLAEHAGPRPGAATLRQLEVERQRETTFARVSAGRVSAGMPKAMGLGSPEARQAAVEQLLGSERRYATQQAVESMRRLQGAVNFDRVAGESPLGAMWLLGPAKDHTEGCMVMQRRFWPWAVLHRVHPPRHHGCTGYLIGLNEAVGAGLMGADDIPTLYDAINDASGVMMEGAAEQLLAELEVREQLIARGVGVGQLARIPWLGEGYVAEAFDSALHPRDFKGRWAEKLGELGVKFGGDWSANPAAAEAAAEAAHGVLSRYDLPEVKTIQIAPYLDESGRFASKSRTSVDLSAKYLDNAFMANRHAEMRGLLAGGPNDPVGRKRVITHELGHILDGALLSRDRAAYDRLDAFLNEMGGYGMPGQRPRLKAGLEAPSAYGSENRFEFVAEALTDWIHNGEQAHPSSVFIGKLFDQALGKRVAESFDEVEHPRGWHGRFRKVGEVAQAITDTMLDWRANVEKADMSEAPPREEIVANWTRQVRGRLSKDRAAIGAVAAAQAENAANPRWQAFTAGLPADHVIVTQEPGQRRVSNTLLATDREMASRKAHTTVIGEEAAKAAAAGERKSPPTKVSVTSGYGLAALLRHEYGHSIDDSLPRDVRRSVLDAIPDPEKDLTYYAGQRDNEVIPELVALITHPDYRSADWPETVQLAEKRLRAALGVEPPPDGGRVVEAAAALKRGEAASIRPEHAPGLIDALNDGERSSLHKLQVEGHPNLFRVNARDLPRSEMPQIPKDNLPGFMDFLREHRVMATVEQVEPGRLRATQNQINGAAAAAIARGWDPQRGGILMISHEGDVLDGHHRWAAAALYGMGHDGYKIDVLRFTAGTDEMLRLMREYNAIAGVQARRFGEGSIQIGATG